MPYVNDDVDVPLTLRNPVLKMPSAVRTPLKDRLLPSDKTVSFADEDSFVVHNYVREPEELKDLWIQPEEFDKMIYNYKKAEVWKKTKQLFTFRGLIPKKNRLDNFYP